MIFNKILNTTKRSSGENSIFGILLHHTGAGDNYEGMSRFLSGDSGDVSTHYVVGSQGEVSKIGADTDMLWHAGMGKHPVIAAGQETNMNKYFIGIEIDSDGYNFTETQREKVEELCAYLCNLHKIPVDNILRHLDLAGYRGKWDTGINFFRDSESPITTFRASVQKKLTPIKGALPKEDKIMKLISGLARNYFLSDSEEQKERITKKIMRKLKKIERKKECSLKVPEYLPQGKTDCKVATAIIIWQGALLNHGKETIVIDPVALKPLLSDYTSRSSLKEVYPSYNTIQSIGILHRDKDVDDAIRKIEKSIYNKFPVGMVLKHSRWGYRGEEGNREIVPVNQKEYGGHAAALFGFDEEYFYGVNPWEKVVWDFKIKKKYIKTVAGGFLAYQIR